jgi:putative colanic acid biosynthesis acetyltransferase WcaF
MNGFWAADRLRHRWNCSDEASDMDTPLETDSAYTRRGTVDISRTSSPHSLGNRWARSAWMLVYCLFFRPSPRPFHAWRRFLLRVFGARLGRNTKVFSSAKIWAPWNLTMADHSTIGPYVDCYCVAPVQIGTQTVISQYCFLCTATHDFDQPQRPLRAAPITVGEQVWLAADVYIGPGVTIGEGTVVGARSSVFQDLPSWCICVGTPARPVKPRTILNSESVTCTAR